MQLNPGDQVTIPATEVLLGGLRATVKRLEGNQVIFTLSYDTEVEWQLPVDRLAP